MNGHECHNASFSLAIHGISISLLQFYHSYWHPGELKIYSAPENYSQHFTFSTFYVTALFKNGLNSCFPSKYYIQVLGLFLCGHSTIQAWLEVYCKDGCPSEVLLSPQRNCGALTEWPSGSWSPHCLSPRLPSLDGQPALKKLLLVLNFFQICASKQSFSQGSTDNSYAPFFFLIYFYNFELN